MKKTFIKTLSTVFILTAIAKVLGLLREIVFANVYGTGIVADSYFAALKIPTQIVDIVLSSAITSTFIPVFNEILQKEGKDKANHFAGNFINLVAVIATAISIIGIIIAPILVKVFTPGFSESAYLLTIDLLRITFPMIIFTALTFSFIGLLQSYGEYNIPASTSGISNLAVILFLLLFRTRIDGLCYFMVFAWLLQLVIQLPFAHKFGYKFKFFIDVKDQNLKKVFLLAIPILLSTAVIPINNLVSMGFASTLEEGAYSSLEYAYRIYIVIYGIFTYAIGNVIFPELSRQSSKEDKTDFINLIHRSILLIAFLLIPLTIGIMIFSKDIIHIIYERGEFTANSTITTSGALFFYSIGIAGAGLVEIMNKAFYARQKTKAPLFVGVSMIITNIILCYLFVSNGLGYKGLALATALNAFIYGFSLLVILRKDYKEIINKDILLTIVKILGSSLLMACIVLFLNNALIESISGSIIKDIIRLRNLWGTRNYYILWNNLFT